MLGAALDTVILTASEQGFSTDSVQLTQLRLLVVADLENAGCNWRVVNHTTCRKRSPAMVAPYRFTGKQLELATAGPQERYQQPVICSVVPVLR